MTKTCPVCFAFKCLSTNTGANFLIIILMMSDDSSTTKSKNVWSLGSYNEIAIFALPVSAHLVRLCDISSNDHVLDVSCGTGNTSITASLMTGAKVGGVDFTPEHLGPCKGGSIFGRCTRYRMEGRKCTRSSF